MTPEEFRDQWIQDRPLYEDFAAYSRQHLESRLKELGIVGDVVARAKDVPNLLTKVLRKGYKQYEEVTDKAGARVVVWYPECISSVDELIRSEFQVHKFEDKAALLRPDQFAYGGKHYDVTLRESAAVDRRFLGLSCEIQLHTRAQNLWSDVSHDLTYKPTQQMPDSIYRTVNRLVALVELFDNQVISVQGELRNLPDYQEAEMLHALEGHYYRFFARKYDREMSLQVLAVLKPLYEADEIDDFPNIMRAFIGAKYQQLFEVFETYANDSRCSPFLLQPECFAIFERLEADPFELKEAWQHVLPVEYLVDTAAVWGVDIALE